MKFDFDRHGSAFLDMRLHRLRVLITAQSDQLLEKHGIQVPSPCLSVVLFLWEADQSTLSQVADALGYSTQLINQRINQLQKSGFVKRQKCVKDRRRVLLSLTTKGKAAAKKTAEILPGLAEIYENLFNELNGDLDAMIRRFDHALRDCSISERFSLLKD